MRSKPLSYLFACITGVISAAALAAGQSSTVVYDSFNRPGGYTLEDYNAKWSNPYGMGEMSLGDTRNFRGGRFNINAAPFRTAFDMGVFDHIKYLAVSNQAWQVPVNGSITFSVVIDVETPGTIPNYVVHGTYTQSGLPYSATLRQGQQAGATLHMIDFYTGQLFDWFVSGNTAFTLTERLPSIVTGSPLAVGRDKMYTQIIREVPISPGPHLVAIKFSRAAGNGSADFLLDGRLVSHIDNVGIPLDVLGVPFTGTYPSLGPGESIASQMNSVVIGHGLFSLVDAFPFQHPDAPELSVSIPLENRIFGQGANARFDNFTVTTTGQ